MIEEGDYAKAWSYHELEYSNADYSGNAKCYNQFMIDVITYLCSKGEQLNAEVFIKEYSLWFEKNVTEGSYMYSEVKSRLVKSI